MLKPTGAGVFEPTGRRRLSPAEPFKLNGVARAQTVGDFWAWALSDLQDNTTRGLLAEYIVASALGAELRVRDSWANVDLVTPDAITVEVKSCARLQSWRQPKLSAIRFAGLRARAVNDQGGYSLEPEYRAEAYVFGLQSSESHEIYETLDFGQWVFWVVPREALVKLAQASLGLSALRRLAGEAVSYEALEGTFEHVIRQPRNLSPPAAKLDLAP